MLTRRCISVLLATAWYGLFAGVFRPTGRKTPAGEVFVQFWHGLVEMQGKEGVGGGCSHLCHPRPKVARRRELAHVTPPKREDVEEIGLKLLC